MSIIEKEFIIGIRGDTIVSIRETLAVPVPKETFFFAVLNLCCGIQAVGCSVWDLIPQIGMESGPSALGSAVLTCGPSEKSPSKRHFVCSTDI